MSFNFLQSSFLRDYTIELFGPARLTFPRCRADQESLHNPHPDSLSPFRPLLQAAPAVSLPARAASHIWKRRASGAAVSAVQREFLS